MQEIDHIHLNEHIYIVPETLNRLQDQIHADHHVPHYELIIILQEIGHVHHITIVQENMIVHIGITIEHIGITIEIVSKLALTPQPNTTIYLYIYNLNTIINYITNPASKLLHLSCVSAKQNMLMFLYV